ncbi:MAG: PA2169 family four-helix-bundle protein [Chitinophagaceae bacterium]
MQSTKETVEVLNDLVQINNDRITGYEHAIKELADADTDLKVLFENMIDQSRQVRLALGNEVQVLGADMDMSTTTSGKIYKAWMDIKAVFTGHDRHTVLSNCEFGEDAAQKAYKMALESDDLPAYLREMIEQQKATLRSSHDEIKALRDQKVRL